MRSLTPIIIEWNSWNGFIFSILAIETNNFQGELVGVNFSKSFLVLNIFYFTFQFPKNL